MSLGRIVLVLLIFVGLNLASFAEAADEAPSTTSKSKRRVEKSKKFSINLGYITFTDPLEVNDSVQKENGFANYAGLVALVDHIWTNHRWMYQVGAGIAAGKANAGGFSPSFYSDGTRRAWTYSFLEFAAHYRINRAISLGAGLMSGIRSADWTSQVNPAIQSKAKNKTIYAPELVMRVAVSKRLTFIQSMASPDLRGNTIWRWTGAFSL